jgi:nitric oxide reductase subunit C
MLTLFLVTLTAQAGSTARPAMFDTVCVACHAVGGSGGQVGPALDGVGTRRTTADLDKWLKDPQAYKPGTIMPKVDMTDAQRAEMVKWLSSLK